MTKSEKLKAALWPQIIDEKSARAAAKLGVWAALFNAGATLLITIISSSSSYGQLGSYWDVAVFTMIAIGIWRYSRSAAILGFVIYIVGQTSMIAETGKFNIVMLILIVSMYLNAIRGTFAYHKFKLRPLPDGGGTSSEISLASLGDEKRVDGSVPLSDVEKRNSL